MIAPQDGKAAAVPFLMQYVFQHSWFELMFSPSLCLEWFLSASVPFAHTAAPLNFFLWPWLQMETEWFLRVVNLTLMLFL